MITTMSMAHYIGHRQDAGLVAALTVTALLANNQYDIQILPSE